MAKNKHLSFVEREVIQKALDDRISFKGIARMLDKDCSTISKEIRNHIEIRKIGCPRYGYNSCKNRFSCRIQKLCNSPDCKIRYCKACRHCSSHCPSYIEEPCLLLNKPPYVCNGCKNRNNCTLKKHFYIASFAHAQYQKLRSECRQGVAISESEMIRLNRIISPLIQNGQSIHNICSNHANEIMFSEKTIYNYIDSGYFDVINLDLPRKVRYRPRKSQHTNFKLDRSCRIGRTMKDFQNFMLENPDRPLVEMDTVIGQVGGKVLLTLHFVEAQFMLAFLRDSNTSQSVIDIFNMLYEELTPEVFKRLFPVILTDNGSEFSNPNAIEFDNEGNRRTYIFYCDPSAPYQKGAIENNHELIRRVCPKGTSFDELNQEKIQLLMNHINSYKRKKLHDLTPYEMFETFHGKKVLDSLDAILIPPDNVILKPALLK